LHEHCPATDVVALDKQSLFPAFSYVHQILHIPFEMCKRQYPNQIAFSMQSVSLKVTRLNLLQYTYHRLFFPRPAVCDNSSFSFDSVGVANIEEYRQRIENDRLITSPYVQKCCKFYKKETNTC